ncbi:hypothetical protein C3941_21095 [Kaistia algarum]|uniref:COG4223 family protein n=1 Tax=Kaistia algarum TaxID=2083279 RepID=UPI000CE92C96|nr:mitofilin family membrane protein [Kaistia algarum]MCX5514137.1 mitofilin family membrane protein [Kaistia algarum]PPE77904.1 hypothetical protein C3941_21095 [Kaistia algarum]
MADADESKPETGKTAEGRRRRPPVTIDLEAEAVAEVPAESLAGETAAADPEVAVTRTATAPQSEAPAGAYSDPESMTATEETISTEAIDRRRAGAARFVPVLAAAVLGGVVGGLVTAFILAPAKDTVTDASVDSRFATVGARLDRIEAAAKEQPAAAAAPQDEARLAAIETTLSELKSAAPAPSASAPAAAVDLGPLEGRIAALESRPAEAQAPTVDLTPLEAKIGGLQSRLDQIEAHPPVDPKTEIAAQTIALTSLRQAASSGGAFADEIKAYQALGGDASVLAPLASAGAPSLETLKASFPAVADQIRTVSAKPDPNASVWDRLAASAGSLVSVKPAGPIEGSSPTAILSRIEAAVTKGDLPAALREADGLDAAAKVPLADWADGAQRRIAIDAALGALPAVGASNG